MRLGETLDQKTMKVSENFHPVFAMVEVTSQCNASCAYCYVEQEGKTEDLDTEKMLAVFKKLDESGIMFLGITGGEPFFRKDILAILKYITTKDFFQTNILTNGTLITEEHCDFLIAHRRYFPLVRFSVFSHDPDQHDNYIGVKGAFDKVMHAAEILQKGGVKVMMALNVLDFNAKTWAKTRRFFIDTGYEVTVGMLKVKSTAYLNELLDSSSSQDFFNDVFAGMDSDFKKQHTDYYRELLNRTVPDVSLCVGIKGNINVDSSGTISPCSSFRQLKIGNVLETRSIQTMLKESNELLKIRAITKADIEGCRDCKYINCCSICIGMVYSEHGSVTHKPEQFCKYMQALAKAGDLV